MPKTIAKDLLARFLESAQATGATVETSPRNVQDLTASLLKATADDQRVLFAQPDFISPELFTQFIHDKFGYKKEYHKISKRVGDNLIDQIRAIFSIDRDIVILANGVSCREQIGSEISDAIYHPIQFLEILLT